VAARFSIVYPTRHRPEFIRQALHVLEAQGHTDFEVIVSDNYLDPSRSCVQVCRDSAVPNLQYVRPPKPVGMVENWTYALSYATGDYVCYLTDKMFILPGALRRVNQAIVRAGQPEIVSWVSDAYYPQSFDDYFGSGEYWVATSDVPTNVEFRSYSPDGDLDRRGRAEVARGEQTSSDYCRGKLAFGAYRRELIERILARYGALFHNIAPDYTSMVLGLSESERAIEMTSSCVVSVSTDVSNGMLTDTHDAAALDFLNSLEGGADSILPRLLVPGLYASQHNWVAHDYLSLRGRFGLTFDFDTTNWLTYCWEDIHRPSREWSTPQVEAEQKGLLDTFMASLDPGVAERVKARIGDRTSERAAAAEARLAEPPPPAQWPAPIRIARRAARRAWTRKPAVTPPATYSSIEAALAGR
jgi:hypothetical protein